MQCVCAVLLPCAWTVKTRTSFKRSNITGHNQAFKSQNFFKGQNYFSRSNID